MFKLQLLGAALCLALAADAAHAHGWSVGIRLGAPYGPPAWGPHPWGYYHYRPYPLVYEPVPVVVRPAPVYVQPVPAVVPVPAATAPVPAITTAAPAVLRANHEGSTPRVEQCLQQLNDPHEAIRRDAAMELGRMKVQRAVEPLTSSLAGDGSPAVRDAAARALGLIAAPRSLNALIHAAQADRDRDVRHSAQFAVEIIRTNLRTD
jgi:hypothetical protein